MDISHNFESSDSFFPVNPIVLISIFFADLTAFITFLLIPLVDIATKVSPDFPIPYICLENIFSKT